MNEGYCHLQRGKYLLLISSRKLCCRRKKLRVRVRDVTLCFRTLLTSQSSPGPEPFLHGLCGRSVRTLCTTPPFVRGPGELIPLGGVVMVVGEFVRWTLAWLCKVQLDKMEAVGFAPASAHQVTHTSQTSRL